MPLYRYVKAQRKQNSRLSAAVSFFFMATGIVILVWTLWPIVSFTAVGQQLFIKTVSPVSDMVHAQVPVDYSNANLWFPTSPQKKVTVPVNSYRLFIPKLKIQNATVTIAGDDLKTSLIHYGGTALPGQYGNTVIFGHSTLTQFYNPANYKTIFSMLATLQIGDAVTIEYDNIRYTYHVYDMVVVEPTDLSPLEQRFDDSYLTLVTCVPPGTYWKRLNVKAKLDKVL